MTQKNEIQEPRFAFPPTAAMLVLWNERGEASTCMRLRHGTKDRSCGLVLSQDQKIPTIIPILFS
jgi:hypothetical protein